MPIKRRSGATWVKRWSFPESIIEILQKATFHLSEICAGLFY